MTLSSTVLIVLYCCVDEMKILIRWDIWMFGVAVGDSVRRTPVDSFICSGGGSDGVGGGDIFLDGQRQKIKDTRLSG